MMLSLTKMRKRSTREESTTSSTRRSRTRISHPRGFYNRAYWFSIRHIAYSRGHRFVAARTCTGGTFKRPARDFVSRVGQLRVITILIICGPVVISLKHKLNLDVITIQRKPF